MTSLEAVGQSRVEKAGPDPSGASTFIFDRLFFSILRPSAAVLEHNTGTQARSRTSARGRAAAGSLPVRTNWRATTANTPATGRSSAVCASAPSRVPTTWRCTWSATSTSDRRHRWRRRRRRRRRWRSYCLCVRVCFFYRSSLCRAVEGETENAPSVLQKKREESKRWRWRPLVRPYFDGTSLFNRLSLSLSLSLWGIFDRWETKKNGGKPRQPISALQPK